MYIFFLKNPWKKYSFTKIMTVQVCRKIFCKNLIFVLVLEKIFLTKIIIFLILWEIFLKKILIPENIFLGNLQFFCSWKKYLKISTIILELEGIFLKAFTTVLILVKIFFKKNYDFASPWKKYQKESDAYFEFYERFGCSNFKTLKCLKRFRP